MAEFQKGREFFFDFFERERRLFDGGKEKLTFAFSDAIIKETV